MRTNLWTISLLLLSSLLAGSAMAADAATENAQGMATEARKPTETISNTTDAVHDEKNCPMHKANKDSIEKHGEPCPYIQDMNHPGKTHEKCDHGQRS